MDPLLDPDILEDFDYLSRKQGRDIYIDMVGRLAGSWPARLAELQNACAAGSTTAVGKHLHALKGTAASLGLRQLAIMARDCEHRVAAGILDVDLNELNTLVERSLAAARAHRSG